MRERERQTQFYFRGRQDMLGRGKKRGVPSVRTFCFNALVRRCSNWIWLVPLFVSSHKATSKVDWCVRIVSFALYVGESKTQDPDYAECGAKQRRPCNYADLVIFAFTCVRTCVDVLGRSFSVCPSTGVCRPTCGRFLSDDLTLTPWFYGLHPKTMHLNNEQPDSHISWCP